MYVHIQHLLGHYQVVVPFGNVLQYNNTVQHTAPNTRSLRIAKGNKVVLERYPIEEHYTQNTDISMQRYYYRLYLTTGTYNKYWDMPSG